MIRGGGRGAFDVEKDVLILHRISVLVACEFGKAQRSMVVLPDAHAFGSRPNMEDKGKENIELE